MSNVVAVARIGQLPKSYEAAKAALEKCSSIDECKDWKDKAAALASYAKQAGDNSLFHHAERIKARAIRRGGELAKMIPPKSGARSDLGSVATRGGTAKSAGVSPRQLKQMVQVANIPKADFDRQVDSDTPPRIRELATREKDFEVNPRSRNSVPPPRH